MGERRHTCDRSGRKGAGPHQGRGVLTFLPSSLWALCIRCRAETRSSLPLPQSPPRWLKWSFRCVVGTTEGVGRGEGGGLEEERCPWCRSFLSFSEVLHPFLSLRVPFLTRYFSATVTC